ncbi:GtrA family protein [Mycoplasmatota bacterium]|nr:GtrA family protein [Mycoplasmatota bacterium]
MMIKNIKQNEQVTHVIKFTLFSISAGVIQVASFSLLHSVFKVIYWPAYLIALVLSVLWNFTLNRKFTFKSAANIPKAMFKVAIYYAFFTPLSTWIGDYLVEDQAFAEYFVLAGTMIINFVTEFIYTKYFVYHNEINTATEIVSS